MRLILIVEDWADAQGACTLIDRVLVECGPDWIDAETIGDIQHWTGIDPDSGFTKWTDLDKLATRHSIKQHGRRGYPDQAATRKTLALAVAATRSAAVDAVVLVRDLDNQPERRAGLDAAREQTKNALPFEVVVGVADPKREAWVLNGFLPETDQEKARCVAILHFLGVHPMRESERLRGDRRRDDAERDIKRVLGELTQADPERERRCLAETALPHLMECGTGSGLAAFLREVHDRLLPLVDSAPRQPCAALEVV